jgi:hypothetical protein
MDATARDQPAGLSLRKIPTEQKPLATAQKIITNPDLPGKDITVLLS